ncbi:polymorphic toxin-type HINT domain-containing protein [Kitasatospora sp. NPDC015120]|uniref:polymorphic toxin-type HINT domain-containing protein n=1 Tax=Kitasatospora sp. NPDC015120 TaxID=3364023 RepID=UPI0036F457FB
MSSIPRVRPARTAAGLVIGGLLAGLLTVPATAADTTPATGPDPDRVRTVAARLSGGPAVRQAAESALTGSADDLRRFLATGQAGAAEQDLRAGIEELVAASGPGVREAGTTALDGPASALQSFLATGVQKAFDDDQRIELSRIMADGGPAVREAAGRALDGTTDDVNAFLSEGQFKAQDDDDRIRLSQLMATGGPEVRRAAGAALDGGTEDVRQFLQYGYQTAAAHDQETLTVAQLADLTRNASTQAGRQARTARDAAGRALDATALAKAAAERAAAETKQAQGQAGAASNAAGRAADAAGRAANAAQIASSAAKAANEAARQAASAAAAAASAATKAGDAASRALAAAAAAAGDAGKADLARAAAVTAREAAVNARTAAEASQWAGLAASQAGAAARSADSAGANAVLAASAAAEAADYSGVADTAVYRARQAAARAKSAAAEAKRAAAATVRIAGEAASAAAEAQRAANAAAAHAEAAAAAAGEAAAHAGDASRWATTAQTAATAAGATADSAANSAAQAHKVADIARAVDQERLDAQQATETAAAEEAGRAADLRARTAAWEAGRATRLAADTEQLVKDATAPGVDPEVAVLKGRQAAIRLLDAGGPWTKAAARTALEGDDAAVRVFLGTALTLARERDDRTSVMAIARSPGKLEKRLAAEAASVGTVEDVRTFLATGQYPGKDDDDRVLVSQIMAAGGPGVKDAAGKALDGTIADVRAFLEAGQYRAREDDNRVQVTQALTTGGPEVRAAAQAVLSGPADRLEPFLQSGWSRAQERDATTAAHVATVQSYLATIDGQAAVARRYALEANQSYATARGAAAEAANYAAQARTSAAQATDWAAKAAQAARQAQASAAQAAASAQQARTSAASATEAAGRAGASVAVATDYASQAHQYAADAKTAADQAHASAVAAQKSSEEAQKAADDAKIAFWKKQEEEDVAAQVPAETSGVEGGDDGTGSDPTGRTYYVERVPRDDLRPSNVKQDMSKCITDDPATTYGAIKSLFGSNHTWYENAAGKTVCKVKVTARVSGTVDYLLRTCPESGLTIEACKGRYQTWDTMLLGTEQLNGVPYETKVEMTYQDYKQNYDPQVLAGRLLWHMLTGDFVKCFNNPGLNKACGLAVATILPIGTLTKAAKGVVSYRFAIISGIGVDEARLALQTTLNGYSQALVDGLNALADKVAVFRLTLVSGVGTEEALFAIRANATIDRTLMRQLEIEAQVSADVRTMCNTNSFPAGTSVVMADGSSRPIESLKVGDRILSTDPTTGITGPQTVTDTLDHDTDRLIDLDVEQVGRVTSTAGHLLYVDNTGWREVSTLRIGDILIGQDGARHPVTGLDDRPAIAPEKVYDLTVDGPHTFYVQGRQDNGSEILAHNCYDLLKDELTLADAHTISDHVAFGVPGPNGPLGITVADARLKAIADGSNGVFTDLATAEAALRKAVQQNSGWLATFRSSGRAKGKFKTTLKDLTVNGQNVTSLGTIYVSQADRSVKEITAGTRVEVRMVSDPNHPGGRNWFVSSIFPILDKP